MQKKLLLTFLISLAACTIPTKTEAMVDYIKGSFKIFSEFLRKPNQIAALSESSPALVNTIIEDIINRKTADQLNILELGFGTGPVTKQIIKNMDPKDYLDAIEFEETFYTLVKTQIEEKYTKTDLANVHLHRADFTQWNSDFTRTYDIIICTIPFTRLPKKSLEEILEKIDKLLKPDGSFTYISILGARFFGKLKLKTEDRKAYSEKMDCLDAWTVKTFSQKNQRFVLMNMPPAWVYHLTKNKILKN